MITALSDAPQQIMVRSSNQGPRAYAGEEGLGLKKTLVLDILQKSRLIVVACF